MLVVVEVVEIVDHQEKEVDQVVLAEVEQELVEVLILEEQQEQQTQVVGAEPLDMAQVIMLVQQVVQVSWL
tara:strand:+ start:461 stop:673 length:213 start_codon:yes stop_codon:yes gene_type:complete